MGCAGLLPGVPYPGGTAAFAANRESVEKETLFTIEPPERGASTPAATVYVCPRCWARVGLFVVPEEAPLCAPCGERMRVQHVPRRPPATEEAT